MQIQEAVILAGGKGTRLREVVDDVPKVMADINGHPFLEFILDYLNNNLITRVILSVGYKHEVIEAHFGRQYKNIELEYVVEETPLGTGGAIQKAFNQVKGYRAFVFNGDTLFLVDLDKFANYHRSKQSMFSMVLRNVEDVSRYGTVELDENGAISAFYEKNQKLGWGFINGGTYLINKSFFEQFAFPEKFSIEHDCFEKLIDRHIFYGLICRQFFIDIGTPDDYRIAQDELKGFEY